MTYIKIEWNDKSATSSFVSNCFYFVLWSRMVGRNAQTYEKLSFFSVFSRLDPFLQISWQIKERLLLELH